MKKQLENVLKKLEEDLNKELLQVRKENKSNNCLSNNSEENQILKKYWKKKERILEKYNNKSS